MVSGEKALRSWWAWIWEQWYAQQRYDRDRDRERTERDECLVRRWNRATTAKRQVPRFNFNGDGALATKPESCKAWCCNLLLHPPPKHISTGAHVEASHAPMPFNSAIKISQYRVFAFQYSFHRGLKSVSTLQKYSRVVRVFDRAFVDSS